MSSVPASLQGDRPRLGFIDAARILAMLLMVQGHVCDTLLAPAHKATTFFSNYWTLRGLTAPLFFMLSGFAVIVASDSRWEQYCRPGPKLYARLRRIGALLLIGHLLQMPRWSGSPPFDFTRDEWQYFLRSGVLDCVALSLLVAHVLIAVTRSRRAFTVAAAALALTVALVTPAVASSTADLPLPIAMLVRTREGSLFPLFPYLSHFFLGAVLGRLFLDAKAIGRSAYRIGALAGGVGLAMYVAGSIWLGMEPERMHSTNSDMALFLSRAGKAWLLFAAVALIAGRRGSFRWMRSASSNALSIYVLHLVAIYGAPGVHGLLDHFGPTLSLPAAFALGPALLAACALAMAGWDRAWALTRAAGASAWARLAARLQAPEPVPERTVEVLDAPRAP